MLRPIPLRHYVSVMESKGFLTEIVLDGTAIDSTQLDSPNYLIELQQYHQLVENMIRLTGDRDIGMDVGLSSQLSDFGILGYAAVSCRTVRQSINELWTGYGDAMGIMTHFAIPTAEANTLSADIVAPLMSASVYRFCVEEALCILLKLGGLMTGEEPIFEALEFSYASPSYVQRYIDIFHCPLQFSCERTRVTIAKSWLDQPLQTRNDELNSLYQQHLRQLQRQIEESSPITMRIRGLLMHRGGNFPSLEEIAKQFGVSSRTLRRQFEQQGSSYRELVEECRIELAQGWLRTSQLSAKEIGHQLGFSDVNAFRRAFKGWTGKTVREFRSVATE